MIELLRSLPQGSRSKQRELHVIRHTKLQKIIVQTNSSEGINQTCKNNSWISIGSGVEELVISKNKVAVCLLATVRAFSV